MKKIIRFESRTAALIIMVCGLGLLLISAYGQSASTVATLRSTATWAPVTRDIDGGPVNVASYVMTLTPLTATNGLPALATNVISGTSSVLKFAGTNRGPAKLWVAAKSSNGLLGDWASIVIDLSSIPSATTNISVQLELNVTIAP